MLTSAKMQDNSTLMWKNFENILKVIQAFHTVRIVLNIGSSGPVVGSLTVSYWFYLDTQLLGHKTLCYTHKNFV